MKRKHEIEVVCSALREVGVAVDENVKVAVEGALKEIRARKYEERQAGKVKLARRQVMRAQTKLEKLLNENFGGSEPCEVHYSDEGAGR